MKLFDAHNHLQDDRFKQRKAEIIAAAEKEGVARMVVNGSSEEDWNGVFELAREYPRLIVPSFGLHPWYVSGRSKDWQAKLIERVEAVPSAIGEIGLDKWILKRKEAGERREKAGVRSQESEGSPQDHVFKTQPASLEEQQEVFVWQWRLAAERNLPASIHCLQAWGTLLEILKREPRPQCGFVLHSFGGPREMIGQLTELGAYFSLPGYFAHERKVKQREAFRQVPSERLLIETDAPDQCLPEDRDQFDLKDTGGERLNHPGNLRAVYELAAEVREETIEKLAEQVDENFKRVFGRFV